MLLHCRSLRNLVMMCIICLGSIAKKKEILLGTGVGSQTCLYIIRSIGTAHPLGQDLTEHIPEIPRRRVHPISRHGAVRPFQPLRRRVRPPHQGLFHREAPQPAQSQEHASQSRHRHRIVGDRHLYGGHLGPGLLLTVHLGDLWRHLAGRQAARGGFEAEDPAHGSRA